jgi:hypothetical protein
MQADSNGPEPPSPLEVQRRMLRITAQQLIGLVRETAREFRKLAIAVPESLIGVVPHRSVQRPARRSSRASSARASRRPAAASSSIRRSHTSASNSANHVRNTASSAAESPRTASSISLTLPIISSLLRTVVPVQLYSCFPVRRGQIDPACAPPGESSPARTLVRDAVRGSVRCSLPASRLSVANSSTGRRIGEDGGPGSRDPVAARLGRFQHDVTADLVHPGVPPSPTPGIRQTRSRDVAGQLHATIRISSRTR